MSHVWVTSCQQKGPAERGWSLSWGGGVRAEACVPLPFVEVAEVWLQ